MKILRYLFVACFVLGLTGVANAFQFTVLDPSGSQGSFPAINLNGPNPFSFYDCTVVGLTGNDGCFGAVNNTVFTITSFTGTITADAALPTPLTCPTSDEGTFTSAFSQSSCSVSGDTMTMSFSGGPGVLSGHTMWLVEDGVPDSEFTTDGSFTVTATPEPSSLLLAFSSIGPLGYLVRRRRRGVRS